MSEMEKLMEQESTNRLKRGQIVKGEIIKLDDKTIYLELIDVLAPTEGIIHLDKYTKDEVVTSFKEIVKLGDIVEAQVGSIVEDDEKMLILLTRIPLIADESFLKLKKIVEDQTVINVRVTKVVKKGIVLTHLGNEIFIPFSLLDFDLVEKKEELTGMKLDINVIEAELQGRRKRIIGSRKTIFDAARREAQEEREELRQKELSLINTGDIITGRVDRIDPHAAIVRFENVAGLLRISQVSHYRIEKLAEVLTVGQEVEVKVIKKEGNRLDLSMKALEKTPFQNYIAEHKTGTVVSGKVFQKLPFGIIIELAEDVRGLLHRSEYSWNPDSNFASNVVVEDPIDVEVIGVDGNLERISLSRKSLEDNPWKNVKARRGELVEVPITNITTEGIEVELQGVKGIIPMNEISEENIGKLEDAFKIGDKVKAQVTDINVNRWILKLSMKRAKAQADRASFEEYMEEAKEEEGLTLGDLFGDQLK